MREIFNHPLNPETIDPMYKIMDLNMNGYYNRIFGDIPMMTFDSSRELTQLTTEGQEKVNISDLKIFPEGHVGYNENDEIFDKPGFKIKTALDNALTHVIPGAYYNGGMICDLSNGSYCNVGNLQFRSFTPTDKRPFLPIRISGPMCSKPTELKDCYMRIKPSVDSNCSISFSYINDYSRATITINSDTPDDKCMFRTNYPTGGNLYYKIGDIYTKVYGISLLCLNDTVLGKNLLVSAKYKDNDDRILTFNGTPLTETHLEGGWSEVNQEIQLPPDGASLTSLDFKFIDDLQTVII